MMDGAMGRFVRSSSGLGSFNGFLTDGESPLDFKYSFSANDDGALASGDFVKEFIGGENQNDTIISGDFEIQTDDDGSSTHKFNSKLAWEKSVSENIMVGYFLGFDHGKSKFKGTFTGDQDGFGLSAGSYFINEVNPQLFFDGYASYGRSWDSLKLDDGSLSVKSDYVSSTKSIGGSVTGVLPVNSYALGPDKQYSGFGYYEIWPELQFSYGSTDIGKMDFTGSAYGMVDNTLSIDKKTVSRTSAGFIPHIKVPTDGALIADSQSVLTFSPRLKYEKTRSSTVKRNFGGGFHVGHTKKSVDGLGELSIKLMLDRIGSTTSKGAKVKYDLRF
jgi:hypothetical protein